MSEPLTDDELSVLARCFSTHMGRPTIAVLVQRALSELRSRRAQDLTPIVVTVEGCDYGELTVRALAIDVLSRDVDTAHMDWCQTEREILSRFALDALARLTGSR